MLHENSQGRVTLSKPDFQVNLILLKYLELGGGALW